MDNKLNIKYKNPANGGIFCWSKINLLFLFFIISSACYSQAIVKIEESKKSFGTVTKGEIVELEYKLTNVGNEPLLIKGYDVQCSCTTVKFDSAPVLPNQSILVYVKFDTKTVYDRQDRIVKLLSNNKGGDVKLRFKGMVKRP